MTMSHKPWRMPRDYAWFIRDHEWEAGLVERIRQGYAGPSAICVRDLVDDDCPYYPIGWESAERNAKDAVRTGAVYLDDRSIAKRVEKRKMLKQQMEEVRAAWRAFEKGDGPKPSWGDDLSEAAFAKKKKEKEDREAKRAAREEEDRKWKAQWEERKRKEREQNEAWEERAEILRNSTLAYETLRIMLSKWTCTVCNGKATIAKHTEGDEDGYQLTCLDCGKTAWGKHASLMEVLNR